MLYGALEAGGTKMVCALGDETGKILEQVSIPTISPEETMPKIIEYFQGKGIKALGIACFGPIDPEPASPTYGRILNTPKIPWRNYDIRSAMESRFGVPFFIGNDVNLGVLGEYRFGAARGYRNVVGLFVGTGVGGGLILNGELYTGNQFKAAEMGHMVMDPEGPLCGCGQRGCLEAFSSKQGMSAYIRQQVSRGRDSLLAEAVQAGVFKSKKLKKALLAGDEVALEAVDRSCHYLAVATGSLINIFSPDLVLYGGGVMEAVGEMFLDKILREVDRYCMPEIRSTVELKNAALGDDSVLYGALALMEEQMN